MAVEITFREYAPCSIHVIPTSSERFISFQIASLQFLTASPDTLVQSLAVDDRHILNHIALHYPDAEIVFAKWNYPYEYMNGGDKFFLTLLSHIDAFSSSLSEATISPEEYDSAQKV